MPKKKKTTGLLPSGSYRRRVYVGKRADGSRRYDSITGNSPEEVKAEAAAYRARIRQLLRQGVAVDDITRDGSEVPKNPDSVQKYLDLYLDTCEAAGLSPSTLKEYSATLKRAYAALKPIPVADLTVTDVQEYVNARAKDGASPKTIRNEISLLSAALKPARPDINVRALRIPRKPPREIVIPTTQEVRTMIEAAEGTPLYIPLILAALMGLRRSEICGLKWANVDIKGRTLTVQNAVVMGRNGLSVKGTKTKAGTRTLPLHPDIARALASSRGTDPRVTQLTPTAISRRWEKLLKRLGLSYRFHDLRHFHASMMIAVGAPDTYITADMGHATMHMVQRVYGHVMQDRQAEINAEMAKKIADFGLK